MEEIGLRQVFHFVEAFSGTMTEGLCSFSSSAVAMATSSDASGGRGGRGGGPGLITLCLLQERLDVVAVVAALGPWMARWRAQQPKASTIILEVRENSIFFPARARHTESAGSLASLPTTPRAHRSPNVVVDVYIRPSC